MDFKKVQLRHIGAAQENLSCLESRIDELPVDVRSLNDTFVILHCLGPDSIAPEFRPESNEGKVVYSLGRDFSYDRFAIHMVPDPSPHLVVTELKGDIKYHFYTNGPSGVNS